MGGSDRTAQASRSTTLNPLIGRNGRASSPRRQARGWSAFRRMLGEVVQDALHFEQKLVGHLSREAVADEDALDDEIFAVGRHGVGRNQPAALAQSIGEVVEREARGCGVFQFPAEAGDSAVAVVNNLEGPELGDLFGEIAAQCVTLAFGFRGSPLCRGAGSCSTGR